MNRTSPVRVWFVMNLNLKGCDDGADGVLGAIGPAMDGAFHNGGGATPGGGEGIYLLTTAKLRPMSNSGGQVANASVPPGFSTRSISPTATSGRGAKMCPNWLTTTSKLESANGRLSTSPSCQFTSTVAMLAFSRACASSSGVRSSPVTVAP